MQQRLEPVLLGHGGGGRTVFHGQQRHLAPDLAVMPGGQGLTVSDQPRHRQPVEIPREFLGAPLRVDGQDGRSQPVTRHHGGGVVGRVGKLDRDDPPRSEARQRPPLSPPAAGHLEQLAERGLVPVLNHGHRIGLGAAPCNEVGNQHVSSDSLSAT